jgi:hypothetical protein
MSLNPIQKLPFGFEKTFIPDNSDALARYHRLIRIEHQKECTFMSICSQIKLDEFRKNSSTNQKEQLRQKRKIHKIF